MAVTSNCPLCGSQRCSPLPVAADQWVYFHCADQGGCDLRFLHPAARLQPAEEHDRYRLHDNSPSAGYRQFLEPLFQAMRPHLPCGAHGLDFGAGPNSVLKDFFVDAGFSVDVYDPYFSPDASKLNTTYGFVTASEVAEHFYHPQTEFARLHALLKPGGTLGLMTLLVSDAIDFGNWYYRRDPTHVVFYSRRTFQWIADQFGFEALSFNGDRVVTLRKPMVSK